MLKVANITSKQIFLNRKLIFTKNVKELGVFCHPASTQTRDWNS